MSNLSIQIYKNINSNKPPEISLPDDLPRADLTNPALIKTAKDLFECNGVLLIKQLFSKYLISQLNQAFLAQYQAYFDDQEYADALTVGSKRKMLTIKLQDPFNHPDLYANPLLMDLMRALLGEDFILGSFGAVIALPGADQQHIHQDHPALFDDETLDLKLPSFAITVVVPLINLTLATGSTQVWKGSHRLPYSEALNQQQASVPLVSTGSCYLMDYQLWHGGTPNRSNQVRPILYIVYYRSWFQEAVNYEKQARVLITRDEYQKIPEIHRPLFARVRDLFDLSHPTAPNQASALPSYPDHQTQTRIHGLTAAEQADQLSRIAQQALIAYGFKQAELKLISHGENTVFRVDGVHPLVAKAQDDRYAATRFTLRIHRANYLSLDEIGSELCWLQFLSQEAQLPVPQPVPNSAGQLCQVVEAQGMPEARVCSLTRWVKGRSLLDADSFGRLAPINLEAVGRLIAHLHDQAEHWPIPQNFTRPRWDWNGLFGARAGYSDNGSQVWDLTPQPYKHLLERVSQKFRETVASLSDDPSQFGLIHGDFWAGNLLIDHGQLRLIDFADCGFGYWIYDLARVLNDFVSDPTFSTSLDQLLSGYSQIRAVPAAQLPHITTLIAAQYAVYALWQVNRAQDHPAFRATLAQELQTTAVEIERLLRFD